jgi:hypothetical protein
MSKNLRSTNVCHPRLKTIFANRREQLLMRELCHGSLNTMRKTLHCTLFLLLLCGGAQAQLTVFNVSSSEITDPGKISAQQQFEIGDQVESSTTATYGLGKGWEIGANLINLDYGLESRHFESNDSTTSIPYAPLLLLNAQKVFDINDVFSAGVGAIAGSSIRHLKSPKFVYYTYANLAASFGPDHRYQIAAGPYLGSHGYLSDGAVMGFQTGIDAGIWYEKLHFLADWVSGSHSKGRLTVGFGVFLSDRLPLSVGWQRSNADGAQAAVLQLTLLPK